MGEISREDALALVDKIRGGTRDGWGYSRDECAEFLRLAAKDEAEPMATSTSVPDDLRFMGWSVAVHNDYRANGVPHTFWLFTKQDRAIKGEGETDEEALNIVRSQIATPPTAAQDEARERVIEAQPAAWRITDGEGDYLYITGGPSESARQWSRRYGREYEPLYAALSPSNPTRMQGGEG